jgi:hypothetical protein
MVDKDLINCELWPTWGMWPLMIDLTLQSRNACTGGARIRKGKCMML